MLNRYFLLFVILLSFAVKVLGQALSTDFDVLEDYYRRQQLLGNLESHHSFVAYPLYPVNAFESEHPFSPDDKMKAFSKLNFGSSWPLKSEKFKIGLLPMQWVNQYNSHHPEEWNDGSIIPATGYQTLVSAGFFVDIPFLSIKIQPDYVYAANTTYDGFPLSRNNPELATLRWAQYYFHTLNNIDQPERFGEEAYSEFSWGQSSVRLYYKALSLGYSTENLWWGPGRRNSLLLSNTAPGFAHFTLNTLRPMHTHIGSFEGQIVAGYLKNSGYPPPNTEVADHNGMQFYIPKRDDNRYFNGMLLSYNPKWVNGLHLGIIRSFQMYRDDMDGSFKAYLPIFTGFRQKTLEKNAEETKEGELPLYQKRDQYYSFFMRYVWPEAHVELYGEYGFADNHWDGRDFTLQSEHSAAYVLGFRKLIIPKPFSKHHFDVGVELTQLSKNPTSLRRGPQEIYTQGAKTWYTSKGVRQGYTNQGQLLGAGIGPGSNLFTFSVGWHKGLKSLQLELERYAHNNDFHLENVKDVRMHWVDISAALKGSWDYKNLLFSYQLKFVGAKNYQWVYDYNPNEYWDASGADDVFNFHGQLEVLYRF